MSRKLKSGLASFHCSSSPAPPKPHRLILEVLHQTVKRGRGSQLCRDVVQRTRAGTGEDHGVLGSSSGRPQGGGGQVVVDVLCIKEGQTNVVHYSMNGQAYSLHTEGPKTVWEPDNLRARKEKKVQVWLSSPSFFEVGRRYKVTSYTTPPPSPRFL